MNEYTVALIYVDGLGNTETNYRQIKAWSAEEAKKHAMAMYPTIEFMDAVIIKVNALTVLAT
jgi:hypothetical protein